MDNQSSKYCRECGKPSKEVLCKECREAKEFSEKLEYCERIRNE